MSKEKEELWIIPMALGELQDRLQEEKSLAAFNLLAEWRHFTMTGHFARKRHPKETAFLRKFFGKIRRHFPKEERKLLYREILIFLGEYYVEVEKNADS